MKRKLNSLIRKITGYEIRKTDKQLLPAKKQMVIPEVASDKRPIGRMDMFLEDLEMRGLNCKSIVDVGANRAAWSQLAKKVFPDAKYFLIEPLSEMIEPLKKFCTESPGSKYFIAGAGQKEETQWLTVRTDNLGASNLFISEDDKLKKQGLQREIKILSIDTLIEKGKIEKPELIKLDIQGFELEALRGAEKTFGHTEVYILEVSFFTFYEGRPDRPLFSDVINFMLKRGYVAYDFPGFLRRPIDGALGQCDICFVKKDGFLRHINSWN